MKKNRAQKKQNTVFVKGIQKFSPEKLDEFKNMPIKMRLLWLEEANNFVAKRFPGYKKTKLNQISLPK